MHRLFSDALGSRTLLRVQGSSPTGPQPPAVAGQEPTSPGRLLLAWLDAGRGLRGAAWLGEEGSRWGVLAAAGEGAHPGSGSPEAPEGLAWDLLSEMQAGDWARLGARELRGRPILWARGVREAWLGMGPGADRALWVDTSLPGAWTPERGPQALEELVQTERRDADSRGRVRALELERRASAALGMGHDLRNQISLALLELERLEHEPSLGFQGLRSALAAARHLAQAPLEREVDPGSGVRPRPALGLRALLEQEARAAANLAGSSSRVRLVLRCPAGVSTRAPELELRRLVRNAVLNALRATPAGGCVRVVGEPPQDRGPRISVQDEGHGMDAAQVQVLFRAGESGTGGTGFGSASLLECARSISAEVLVESDLGSGTILRVELAD